MDFEDVIFYIARRRLLSSVAEDYLRELLFESDNVIVSEKRRRLQMLKYREDEIKLLMQCVSEV